MDVNRVLIFGGTGFVGRALGRLLAEKGVEVHATCRQTSAALKDPHVVWWDITDSVETPFERTVFDAVVNCTVDYGRGSQPKSGLPLINTWLPIRLLELSATGAAGRLVHCETYGYKPRTGQSLNTPYTRTKCLGTALLTEDPLAAKLPVLIARLEYVYGNEDTKVTLAPALAEAFRRGADRFPMTDGNQRRDFVWVDDVASALAALVFADVPAGVREVEVGVGQAISLRSFAEKLRDAFHAQTKLDFGAVQRPAGDIEESFADLSTWGSIEWRPTMTVDEGVKKIAAYSSAA